VTEADENRNSSFNYRKVIEMCIATERQMSQQHTSDTNRIIDKAIEESFDGEDDPDLFASEREGAWKSLARECTAENLHALDENLLPKIQSQLKENAQAAVDADRVAQRVRRFVFEEIIIDAFDQAGLDNICAMVNLVGNISRHVLEVQREQEDEAMSHVSESQPDN
jgi:hypothetical protein